VELGFALRYSLSFSSGPSISRGVFYRDMALITAARAGALSRRSVVADAVTHGNDEGAVAVKQLMAIFGIMGFGQAVWRYNMVANLAEEGARRAVVCGSNTGLSSTECDISALRPEPLGGVSDDLYHLRDDDAVDHVDADRRRYRGRAGDARFHAARTADSTPRADLLEHREDDRFAMTRT
jgi:hypothetical protein